MINNRKARRSKGFQKMGMMALSLTLALALGVGSMAATSAASETRTQIHTVQEDIHNKIDELSKADLTDAQKAQLEELETQLKELEKERRGVRGVKSVFFGIKLTDEQQEAIKDMSREEIEAYLEANMTDEQKVEYESQKAEMETRRAEMEANMTDEQKAEMEARRAEWDSLSDEEKQAKMEEMKANTNVEGKGHGRMFVVAASDAVPAIAVDSEAPQSGESTTTVTQSAPTDAHFKKGGIMGMSITLTEEQTAAIEGMSAEEVKAYLEANMTDEQKEAMEKAKAEMEAKRAEMEANMTDEEKAEMEAKLAEELAKYKTILDGLNAIA